MVWVGRGAGWCVSSGGAAAGVPGGRGTGGWAGLALIAGVGVLAAAVAGWVWVFASASVGVMVAVATAGWGTSRPIV